MIPYSSASTSSTSRAITKRQTIATLFETSCARWLISAAVELLLLLRRRLRRPFEPAECGGILAQALPPSSPSSISEGGQKALNWTGCYRCSEGQQCSEQVDDAARIQRPVLQDGVVGRRLSSRKTWLVYRSLYSKPGRPSSAIVVKKFSSGRNKTTFEEKIRVHGLC